MENRTRLTVYFVPLTEGSNPFTQSNPFPVGKLTV
jgi:hypothetical protein